MAVLLPPAKRLDLIVASPISQIRGGEPLRKLDSWSSCLGCGPVYREGRAQGHSRGATAVAELGFGIWKFPGVSIGFMERER